MDVIFARDPEGLVRLLLRLADDAWGWLGWWYLAACVGALALWVLLLVARDLRPRPRMTPAEADEALRSAVDDAWTMLERHGLSRRGFQEYLRRHPDPGPVRDEPRSPSTGR